MKKKNRKYVKTEFFDRSGFFEISVFDIMRVDCMLFLLQAHRHEVTICTYEASANIADHKTNLMDNVGHEIH